jgi:surface polysaccharide O-acyltransferase-like enzyme
MVSVLLCYRDCSGSLLSHTISFVLHENLSFSVPLFLSWGGNNVS